MRRRVAIVGVALAAHGCLLFTNIGGFDSEDGVTSDGGGNAPDTLSPDVVTDGGGASDGDATDAATGCKASDAAFCADFDDGVLQGRWTFIDPSTGGRTLEISNAVAKSPSSSLRSVIDRAIINPPAGDCTYARVSRDLSDLGSRTRARFSFDAWLGGASPTSAAEGALVANLSTNKSCNFIVSLENLACGAVFQFPRDGGMADEGFQADLVLPIGKTWTHVDLDVSFDPSAPSWSLSVNGKRCGAEKVMPLECRSAQTLRIGPGLYCEGRGTGVAEVYLDNIEVR